MRAILFDFDGVIVKSMEIHFEGWQKVLREYGMEMSPEELYVLEGQGLEEVASQLIRKFNLPSNERRKMIEKQEYFYNQNERAVLYPYLIETLDWANQRELKIALVTGSYFERVDEVLRSFGIDGYFDAIVTSNDVYQTKPSPEPFLAAANLLEVEPKDCVVIENSPLGIQSAKSANMQCIAITTTLPPMYLKEADVVADNFHEVLESLKKLY
jgi:beta-phosphoglucomutase